MTDEPDETPIGELFGRLIDEGKAYARAEVGLVKAQAGVKARAWKLPAALLGIALLLVIGAAVTLVMTVAMALATLIGPLAGGLAATLIALVSAGGLALLAMQKLEDRK